MRLRKTATDYGTGAEIGGKNESCSENRKSARAVLWERGNDCPPLKSKEDLHGGTLDLLLTAVVCRLFLFWGFD